MPFVFSGEIQGYGRCGAYGNLNVLPLTLAFVKSRLSQVRAEDRQTLFLFFLRLGGEFFAKSVDHTL